MTRDEAIDYLNGIAPQPVDMVTLDPVVWDDFKTSVLEILASPGVDPKYLAALEAANVKVDEANAIIDGALG